MTTLVQIPFHGTNITAMNDEGKPLVSLRHVCDSLGIDTDSQRKKLLNKPWACTVLSTVQVPGDTQARKWLMIDRRTLTMWLATIEASRVKPEARPVLEAFQNEAADALDAYFHDGGAINPAATTAQLSELRVQAEIAQILRGVVADEHLDNVGRIIIARAMGEKPAIAHEDRALTVSGFLKEKKLNTKESTGIRSTFGRRLSGAYLAHHGEEPPSAPELVNGRDRDVKHYTEKDRHLFEQVWNNYYADEYGPSLMDELAA